MRQTTLDLLLPANEALAVNSNDKLPDFRSFQVGRDFVFRHKDGTIVHDWAEQVERVANKHSVRVECDHLENDVPEGREPVSLRYERVTADVVAMELPWLYAFHVGVHPDGSTVQDSLPELANRGRGDRVQLETSGECIEITINIFRAPKVVDEGDVAPTPPDAMDWHQDFNPQVGLLYTRDREPEDGGAVIFDIDGELVRKYPHGGELDVLDAHSVFHHVEPLAPGSHDRYSVAHNLNIRGVPTVRPDSYFPFVYGADSHADSANASPQTETPAVRG